MINSDLTNKVNVSTFNQLPVSPNSSTFKNDNGLSVVNLGDNGYRDVTARQYYLRGGDHIRCDSNIAITNLDANAFRSLLVNDILLQGSQSAWALINRLSFAGTANSCYSLTGKINGKNGMLLGVGTNDNFGFEVGVVWNEVDGLYFRQKRNNSWDAWYKIKGTIA